MARKARDVMQRDVVTLELVESVSNMVEALDMGMVLAAQIRASSRRLLIPATVENSPKRVLIQDLKL